VDGFFYFLPAFFLGFIRVQLNVPFPQRGEVRHCRFIPFNLAHTMKVTSMSQELAELNPLWFHPGRPRGPPTASARMSRRPGALPDSASPLFNRSTRSPRTQWGCACDALCLRLQGASVENHTGERKGNWPKPQKAKKQPTNANPTHFAHF